MLKKLLRRARDFFLHSRVRNFLPRFWFGFRYFYGPLFLLFRWSLKKTEGDNFYYDLTQKNLHDLASSLGLALRISAQQVDQFFGELLENKALIDHLEEWKISRPWLRDSVTVPGRRVVWYAAVRLLKPKLVVETGVHHGLGALVIISALKKNREEGFEGRYIGTDIDPAAGSMISGEYSELGSVLYGDSLRSLESLSQSIDIFVNDSDHSADYELAEYRTVEPMLSPNALVIGDNTHTSESLNLWSRDKGRDFLVLYEKPKGHWYPGAAVGLSIPPAKPWKIL